MKPQEGDFSEYYRYYIDLVEHDNHIAAMKDNRDRVVKFLKSIPEQKQGFRYAEGKWTPAEIVVHILDAERVFAYRALRISRGDETELPGYDHDAYVPAAQVGERKWKSIIKEYEAVRKATISLFKYLPDGVLDKGAICSGSRQTVRAIGYMIAGHELHHMRVLKHKYL